MNTNYKAVATVVGLVGVVAVSALNEFKGGGAAAGAAIGTYWCMRSAREAKRSAWWASLGPLGILGGPIGLWLAWKWANPVATTKRKLFAALTAAILVVIGSTILMTAILLMLGVHA